MTTIKLYLDEDVRPLLADILGQRGFEAKHTLYYNNSGKTDLQQLEFAAGCQMAILTHNIRDFVQLHELYISKEKQHFGIICAPQMKLPNLVSRTLALLSSQDSDSAQNRILWI